MGTNVPKFEPIYYGNTVTHVNYPWINMLWCADVYLTTGDHHIYFINLNILSHQKYNVGKNRTDQNILIGGVFPAFLHIFKYLLTYCTLKYVRILRSSISKTTIFLLPFWA